MPALQTVAVNQGFHGLDETNTAFCKFTQPATGGAATFTVSAHMRQKEWIPVAAEVYTITAGTTPGGRTMTRDAASSAVVSYNEATGVITLGGTPAAGALVFVFFIGHYEQAAEA